MLTKTVTVAALIVAAATLQASALEGRDGDNNPVPTTSYGLSSAADAYASTRPVAPAGRYPIGETRSADQNAVYWRGRYLGTDPDPNVRLRILREAIGG